MQRLIPIFLISFMTAGCELVGNIFQAGLVVGIIIVLAIVMIAAWLFRKVRRRT